MSSSDYDYSDDSSDEDTPSIQEQLKRRAKDIEEERRERRRDLEMRREPSKRQKISPHFSELQVKKAEMVKFFNRRYNKTFATLAQIKAYIEKESDPRKKLTMEQDMLFIETSITDFKRDLDVNMYIDMLRDSDRQDEAMQALRSLRQTKGFNNQFPEARRLNDREEARVNKVLADIKREKEAKLRAEKNQEIERLLSTLEKDQPNIAQIRAIRHAHQQLKTMPLTDEQKRRHKRSAQKHKNLGLDRRLHDYEYNYAYIPRTNLLK